MPRPQRGTWASARPTTEVLRQVVQAATSIAAALRSLGCDPYNNAARTQFRKWVTADGVDTSHFLGQSSRKGKPGPVPARRPEEILVQHDREQRTTTKLLRRALREVGVADVCARCGVGPEWLGKAMTLEVDHIDGNWRNDRRENLRLLCPNCHAVTPTWCRGGRRSL
ncbi:HNH endonuclease [Streptomyces sp. NPDC088789]|uniref:HNH endonuclease n=1 Tax=Streptomyces sp. NPDC088789 TaxID=3365899 RepID=UPI00381C7879